MSFKDTILAASDPIQSSTQCSIQKQVSVSSLPSSVSTPTPIRSPSSPERSTITPDTTKEGLENGDYDVEEETISVDDNDDVEEKVEIEKDTSQEVSKLPKELPCSSGSITKDGITVELVGQHLWKKFHKLGTEMIITKAGR